jgi:hypothetical protein
MLVVHHKQMLMKTNTPSELSHNVQFSEIRNFTDLEFVDFICELHCDSSELNIVKTMYYVLGACEVSLSRYPEIMRLLADCLDGYPTIKLSGRFAARNRLHLQIWMIVCGKSQSI